MLKHMEQTRQENCCVMLYPHCTIQYIVRALGSWPPACRRHTLPQFPVHIPVVPRTDVRLATFPGSGDQLVPFPWAQTTSLRFYSLVAISTQPRFHTSILPSLSTGNCAHWDSSKHFTARNGFRTPVSVKLFTTDRTHQLRQGPFRRVRCWVFFLAVLLGVL